MALAHVGARSTIESISEASAEARQCNLWFDPCRKQVLKVQNWNFARKRLALAAHADAPPSGIWIYRYQYPSDCLVLRDMQNPLGPCADRVAYEVELSINGSQKTIVTDLPDAVAVYTFDQTATELFSEEFVDCLSHLLAYRIAFSLTGQADLKNSELQTYVQLVHFLPAINANENSERKPREAENIRARER